MKTDTKHFELDADLLDLIEGTRPITQRDLEELGKAMRALEDDPQYNAISLKADLVSEVYHGMEEQGLTPSKLAQKWGKSRQYLSKILSEDKRINFTVDTIVELMALLNRRVEMHFPRKSDHTAVIRCVRQPVKSFWDTSPVRMRAESVSEFNPVPHRLAPKITSNEQNPAA